MRPLLRSPGMHMLPWCCLVLLCLGLPAAEHPAGDAVLVRRIETVLAPFHTAKRPPAANDWLAQHPEPGQTVAEFMAARRRPGTSSHTTIYLQALGRVDAGQTVLLDATQAALEAWYPVLVRRLPQRSLDDIPGRARRTGGNGEQLLSTWLLDVLRADRPADALAVLGLTASDLWPGDGWNYVFGQASLVERVGVWSTARFGAPTEPRRLQRTISTAVHETGHQFGLPHCIRWECQMNGSNHLAETDAAPLWFCQECEAKIAWACGGDPVARFRRLATFAKANGFAPAEAMWLREAEMLETSGR